MSEPNEKTHVRIRAAVAVDKDGAWNVVGWHNGKEYCGDDDARACAGESCHPGEQITFIEAWAARPRESYETIEAEPQ